MTGAADISAGSGSATLASTGGLLEATVRSAANSLQVKAELIDHTGEDNEFNFNNYEDEVFMISPERPKNISNTGSATSNTGSATGSVTGNNLSFNLIQDSNSSAPILSRAYTAVVTARRAASRLRQLNPCRLSTELGSNGSFYTKGDDRISRATVSHSLSNRTNTSCSFGPVVGRCGSCLGGEHAALVSATGGPVALVATDQSFPACLPVPPGGGECLRIIRVEDGSLREITLALADSIGKHTLITGSVICIGSVSHLAQVGTAQYCTDWVRSRWWLRQRLGEGIVVVPLPPVPVAGLLGKSTVRALVETLHWFLSLDSTESVVMRGMHQSLLDSHLGCTAGTEWANVRLCIRLPVSLDSDGFNTVVSEGWGSLPEGIPPLSQAAEELLIGPLLRNLNDTFGLGLSTDPCWDRDSATFKSIIDSRSEELNVLVVGGSHAARLATAFGAAGSPVERITAKGLRLSSDSVANILEKIGTIATKPDIMVIQLLDNNSFYCLGEDGTLCLPSKLQDNRFHVVGELRVANKDQTKALLKLATPILRALPGVKKIVVGCIPRYTAQRCCADTAHLTGSDPQCHAKVMADITAMRRTMRSYCFLEKIEDVQIIDAATICDTAAPDAYVDPVHLSPEKYGKLASHILRLAVTGEGAEQASAGAAPATKRPRHESGGGGRGGGRGGVWGPRGSRNWAGRRGRGGSFNR